MLTTVLFALLLADAAEARAVLALAAAQAVQKPAADQAPELLPAPRPACPCVICYCGDGCRCENGLSCACKGCGSTGEPVSVPVKSVVDQASATEPRSVKPQGRPVMGPLRAALQQYQDRTPVVVQGGQSRLEQPLRWQSKPGYLQIDLMHGSTQVGAYNPRTRVYRPYDAESGTWGEPEAPPLRVPQWAGQSHGDVIRWLQGQVSVPARAAQSC